MENKKNLSERENEKETTAAPPDEKKLQDGTNKPSDKNPFHDPYLRAYNGIASHRYISMIEEAMGTENLTWWMRFGTFILQVITLALLTILLLSGCATKREVQYIPVEKKVTEVVTLRDTVVTVKLQPYRDSTAVLPVQGKDTTSYLKNPYAYSYASYSKGVLHHSLVTPPEVAVKGDVQIKEVVRTDSIPYAVPVPGETVYVNKPKWWQSWLMWWGAGAHVIVIIFLAQYFARRKL